MIDGPVVEAITETGPVIASDHSIPGTAELLRDPDVPALVVQDEPDAVTGIVTEADVVAAVAAGAVDGAVATTMSHPSSPSRRARPSGSPRTACGRPGSPAPGRRRRRVPRARDARDALPRVSRHRLNVSWDAEPLRVDREHPDSA
jgi:CBS domain-containing protein